MLSMNRRSGWRMLLLLIAVLSCLPPSTHSTPRRKRKDLLTRLDGSVDDCINITDRLWDGIKRNDGTSIHEAVRCGVDINDITNEEQELPLTQAAMDGRDDALLALLRLGGKVEGRAWGCTPLHNAVWQGRESTFALLMAAGADPNAAIEKDGRTVLHLASEFGHLRLAQRLVDSGAEVNAKTQQGLTPLDLAVQNRRMAVMGYLKSIGGNV